MWDVIKREPVVVAQAVAGLVDAAIVVAVVFGLDITAEQKAAVSALVVALGTTVATFVGRAAVSPVAAPPKKPGPPPTR